MQIPVGDGGGSALLARRLLVEWCAIVALTGAIIIGLVITGATARLDNAAYDLLIGLRAPPPSDRILIVAIDDSSIAALGRWPWSRDVHARAIAQIARARPAAIAYDVLFTDPGPAEGDARLAAALRDAPVALPVLFEVPGRNGRALDITPPVAPIRGAAAALGHVALPHEADGSARAALLRADGWPHLMEATYRLVYHRPSGAGDIALVPYPPHPGGFRTVPFESVASGAVSPALLRDHIVLVGVTAGGLGDRYVVPSRSGEAIAGIEIQADLLNALIGGGLARELGLPWRLALSLLPTLLLLLAFWRLKPAQALGASIALIGAMIVVPAALLVLAGWWLPPAAGLIGLLIAYPLWGWRRLQAVHGVLTRELDSFAADALPPPDEAAPSRFLDRIGGQAADLSSSIRRLRDLRQLVSDAIESVPDPLVVTTLDDRLLLANAPATALLGATAGSVTERLAAIAEHRDDAELTLADGRSFSLRRAPLTAGDGVQRGWILLLAEITAIRAAEHDREEALEFLSHDMRAPQASIITLLDGGAAPPELAARIAGHARRTLALADMFVQRARLRTTRFAPEETDLCAALAEASDALWGQARRRGIRIATAGLDEPRYVMGERDTLTRLFANLIDNAVKFSADGGEVRCVVTEAAGWVEVLIEDDGPGLAPERADNAFARFGTVRGSGAAPSVGLGLAYVRDATERHGGTVAHVALHPHGARFRVRLPALI
ncbi:CHASE2 domain-containing protein [Sphingomonas sp. AR_OL41]|uniref:CHASE2 domain-containing protein n=1 Tax=Sphingomonas sp. AR_OL41 TaxID=3042729 RepID=UPI00247FCCA7|nr:CHASE2 domain-containing protein [Sphingomonas sp. AR_OL41]MDH7972066.1 CHASE2 domain-containing protein [Sphingomonas sp. AR_OL41]